jgi:hypothetical protein
MPSILLPEVMEQQARLERQIAKERKAQLPKTIEDLAVEWLIRTIPIETDDEDEYKCLNYKDYSSNIHTLLKLPEWAKDYFQIDEYIWEEYMNSQQAGGGAFYLLYKDDEHGFTLVENIGDFHKVWEKKPRTFFLDHPCKDDFYIVYCVP